MFVCGACPGVSVADDLDPRLIAGIPAGMLPGVIAPEIPNHKEDAEKSFDKDDE